MEFAIGVRSPGLMSAGKRLETERPNKFGYRDNPIERGNPEAVARDLPENIRGRLLSLDLRTTTSEELHDLSCTLYWEGYISADAFGEFAIYSLDHPGSFNISSWIDQTTAKLDSGLLAEYPLAIRTYQAGIDAAKGLWQLVEHLNGRLLDVQA
ncbi:hypothetical protein [Luteibacter jiangsuensis]